MRRKIARTLVILSTAFCVVFIFLWLRTSGSLDNAGFERIRKDQDAAEVSVRYVHAYRGTLQIGRQTTRYFEADARESIGAQQTDGWKPFAGQSFFTSASGLKRELGFLERLGFSRTDERMNILAEEGQAIDIAHEKSSITFPCWLPVILFALLPLATLTKRLLPLLPKRRRPLGFCTACGYDLRASPERCPECGRVAAAR